MSEHSITIRLKQLAGDEFEAAAHALWDRMWPQMQTRALKTLRRFPKIQRVTAPDAVANQAFHEFITGLRSGDISNVRDRSSAWALLATIIDRRASNEIRAEMAAKRGHGRVLGESALRHSGDSTSQGFEGIADADCDTSPANDLLDILPEDEQVVMSLWLASYQDQEIAEQLECSMATVRRRRKRSLQLLRQQLVEP